MFEVKQQNISKKIQVYCAKNDIPYSGELKWIPIPFSGEWGISTSFFQLAAQEARSGKRVIVPQRAQEIAEGVVAYLGTSIGFDRAEAVRGYLNLYFSPGEFSRQVVGTVLEQGADFGRGAATGERVMVEFSQPNTHKAFHVGHLRSAILGDIICRILEFAGYEVVRANFYGDIGLHVIKWLWNYIHFHPGEKPEQDITRWMGDLYAEASRRLAENPDLEAQVRELYARWDNRDPEVVALWKETRQWSLDGFDDLYKTLDIRFDRLYSNSEVEQPGKKLVEELIARGIAEDESPEGPVIVRIDDLLGLDKEKYRVMVVLRSDGTALYQTEDLALAVLKFEEYDLTRSIYVVDVRQSMHFQQVWKILEIAGYDIAKQCHHLAYEIVNLPGNVVMASRDGTVVLLEDLIREADARALAVVEEKNPDLTAEQKQSVARAVGLGALKYPMLARDSTKTVTFDWETALDFNGQAAPYIQYAHVRANSILRRANLPAFESANVGTPNYNLDPAEVQLIDLISRTPDVVQRAAAEYKTLHITNQAYELARAFNHFYRQCPVIQAEPDVRTFRLHLVAAARQSIANMLNLLGIEAPEVM
ncbi:MAG: arginine--tRNA ligase [Chloroflexi bacterium]|nr:arginine--tRNA ligase [Chloroflexota bacterium]MBU1662736.1 arginine--tRNA ligase [Chloroflexota bacterium]